jgi:pyruvate dehydrogenase E2 component (dihydrolipoamide acetyltransferase)
MPQLPQPGYRQPTFPLGIAVALPQGLIVPKLRNAEKKTLLEIAKEVRELARKARESALAVEEVTNGTFTISNVSMHGNALWLRLFRTPGVFLIRCQFYLPSEFF